MKVMMNGMEIIDMRNHPEYPSICENFIEAVPVLMGKLSHTYHGNGNARPVLGGRD